MSAPTLEKLPNVVHWGNSRYAVIVDGNDIGLISKNHDSFTTTHKWIAWAAHRFYVGEFDTWQAAAEAIQNFRTSNPEHQNLTKQQNQTKE